MYNVLLHFAWTRALLIWGLYPIVWGLYPIKSQVLSNSQRSCKVGDISCEIISNPTMYPYIPCHCNLTPSTKSFQSFPQTRGTHGYPGHPDITAQNGHTLPGESQEKVRGSWWITRISTEKPRTEGNILLHNKEKHKVILVDDVVTTLFNNWRGNGCEWRRIAQAG